MPTTRPKTNVKSQSPTYTGTQPMSTTFRQPVKPSHGSTPQYQGPYGSPAAREMPIEFIQQINAGGFNPLLSQPPRDLSTLTGLSPDQIQMESSNPTHLPVMRATPARKHNNPFSQAADFIYNTTDAIGRAGKAAPGFLEQAGDYALDAVKGRPFQPNRQPSYVQSSPNPSTDFSYGASSLQEIPPEIIEQYTSGDYNAHLLPYPNRDLSTLTGLSPDQIQMESSGSTHLPVMRATPVRKHNNPFSQAADFIYDTTDAAGRAGKAIPGFLEQEGNHALDAVGKTWKAIPDFLEQADDHALDAVGKTWKAIPDFLEQAGDYVTDAVKGRPFQPNRQPSYVQPFPNPSTDFSYGSSSLREIPHGMIEQYTSGDYNAHLLPYPNRDLSTLTGLSPDQIRLGAEGPAIQPTMRATPR